MDRLGAILLFVRLVECGSFSAVGREAGITQPTVSKQIASLEKYLGAQLVLRTSRQVVITESGQIFYESAKQLVASFDAAESCVGDRQQSPQGLIRLCTAPAHGRLCVMPLLPEFFRRYPDVAVELSVSERQVDMVREGVDLAIRHGPLVDSSLRARKLAETDFVLVATPGYLATNGVPTRFSDLDKHTCVVFEQGRARCPWSLRIGHETVSYVPHGPLLTGDAENIRAAVLCGLGISQVPFWLLADEIRSGQVRVLLTALQPERSPVNLVYPAGRQVPMRMRVFIEYLVEAFKRPER